MFRVRQFINELENEGRLSSSLDGVGGEWKEKGTSSKGLHSLQHREACMATAETNGTVKKKKKKSNRRELKTSKTCGRNSLDF